MNVIPPEIEKAILTIAEYLRAEGQQSAIILPTGGALFQHKNILEEQIAMLEEIKRLTRQAEQKTHTHVESA